MMPMQMPYSSTQMPLSSTTTTTTMVPETTVVMPATTTMLPTEIVPTAMVMGANIAPTTPMMGNVSMEQADRFIDALTRHPKELAYYEQCVLRYNEGMRFTPDQARLLVAALRKNAAGSRLGPAAPFYSVYALELLMKLAMVDPHIQNELRLMSLDDWRLMRLNKYIRAEPIRPLGYNFIFLLSRIIPGFRHEDILFSKKGTYDAEMHRGVAGFLNTYSTYKGYPMLLDSTMHRLPQIIAAPLPLPEPVGVGLVPGRGQVVEQHTVVQQTAF